MNLIGTGCSRLCGRRGGGKVDVERELQQARGFWGILKEEQVLVLLRESRSTHRSEWKGPTTDAHPQVDEIVDALAEFFNPTPRPT